MQRDERLTRIGLVDRLWWVVVWINGTFGVAKTSTVAELVSLRVTPRCRWPSGVLRRLYQHYCHLSVLTG